MVELGATVGSITSDLVKLALDAASFRHAAIAANIANANNEGYRPVRVNFEERLSAYADRFTDRRHDGMSKRIIAGLADDVRAETVIDASAAEKVRLDQEIAKMAQNTLKYQALLEAHKRSSSIIKLAINDGRE